MLRPALVLALSLVACGGSPNTTSEGSETAADSSTGAASSSTGATPTSTGETPTTSTTTDATTGESTTGAPGIDYGEPGMYPVGNTRITVPAGDHELLVELWYPADGDAADAAMKGHPIEEFVPAGPDRDTMVGLLAALSPAGEIGTRRQTRSADGGAPSLDGPFPLLVFSHCFNCVRFSTFSVAEHLASHGFIVAAPDHITLFDDLAGNGDDLTEEALQRRRDDLGAVLDVALAPGAPALPAGLQGKIDDTRVGAYGHSFGAATVGRLAQEDPRVRAALPIAAPVQNPLFPNTHVADITVPLLAILAEEDNSIGAFGNQLIVDNFNAQNPPARLVRVKDAGHWGFTDICGLTAGFSAGCGEGERQTVPGEAFTYLDIAIGRGIASAYALAFFDLYLRDNQAATAYLDAADPAAFVAVESRL